MLHLVATIAAVAAADQPAPMPPAPPAVQARPAVGPPRPIAVDPPPADIPVPAVRARPLRPLHLLFTPDDYPASALRAGLEGRTEFTVQIAPSGRVGGCIVTGTSGSAALDSTACRIARVRFRFEPAYDSQGGPVWDTLSSAVTWVLPPEPPPQPLPSSADIE